MGKSLITQRDAIVERHKKQLARFDNVRLSFWAFSLYKDCPQKYIMMTPRDPSMPQPIKDSYWSIAGSVVHSLWEDFTDRQKKGELEYKDSDFLLDNAQGYYDQFVKDNHVNWRVHDLDAEKHREITVPEIRDSISWLYEELRRQGYFPRDPSTVHMEWSFCTPLKSDVPVELTGRIDLVLEDPTKIHIIDLKDVYKRGNVDWRQLIWYVFGSEPVFDKPVGTAGFCLTKLRDWSWRPPDKRERREKLYKEILETAAAIRRDPFPARTNRHKCGYCPVERLCPEWQRYSKAGAALMAEVEAIGAGEIEL